MKKSEKRICWNCDGDVSLHFTDCPYCGVDLTQVPEHHITHHKELGDPFQTADVKSLLKGQDPFHADIKKDLGISQNKLENSSGKQDWLGMVLLLPGVVLCLFALFLLVFAEEGRLVLEWDQHLAYLYFLGAVPLVFLGWCSLKA